MTSKLSKYKKELVENRRVMLLEELNKLNHTIINLSKTIKKSNGISGDFTETEKTLLSKYVLEKENNVYLLKGRLADNLMHSLKSKKILRFDNVEFLWYIDDLQAFLKRIEYRIKRNLTIEIEYPYKNVLQYSKEEYLNSAKKRFEKIDFELEWIDNLLEGRHTEPLFLYSKTDLENFRNLSKKLVPAQLKFKEITEFLANDNFYMPEAVFTVLSEAQLQLNKEITSMEEQIERIKFFYERVLFEQYLNDYKK